MLPTQPGPFIEYVELSKQSQDHLRKRARFVWEIVEDQKRIRISNRQAVDIRVRRLHLPYCLARRHYRSFTWNQIDEPEKRHHNRREDGQIYTVRP